MSETKVQIRPDLEAQLEDLAAQTHRDQSDLANEAVAAYLDREKRNLAKIREGLEQAKRGEFAPDQEVDRFFAKHGEPGR